MSPADDGRTMPAGLTAAACNAFRDVEEEFHDGLVGELRRRRRSREDLTSDDVYEAGVNAAHAMCQPRNASPRALGSGLIVIGSVGVGSMHPYLNSSWQIALLVLFCVVGIAGVGLALRRGHQIDPSGDPSS